ncbi:uncharacterized protein LOC110706082 [Chenopodium quinoa]|uniref:uncharacterized protein LOC110706082 n=1 Tax=Chenopodium quinoa TaxID=63459 RepID=UPI000B78F0F2|nr:uncharacterized protein LOC110706082 [Chenopodium quinoa]
MAKNVQPLDWQLRLLQLAEQPTAFSKEILQAAQPAKVKNVLIGAYDGTANPEDHLMAFTNLMYFQGLDDATWCRCFPATLKGVAQQWFGNLPAGCVNNFRTLAYLFASNFSMNIPARKKTLDLVAVQQGEKEGLRSYIKRFNLMRIQIPNLPDEVAYTDFFKGLKDGSNFKFDLVRKRVATLQEAMMDAETYIQAVDLCHMGKQGDQKRSEKKESRSQKAAPKEDKKRKDVWMADSTGQPSSKKRKEFTPYSPKYEFNKDNHAILKEVKGRLSLEKPAPMKGDPSKRNQDKHCHFHDDVGHETNECISLKRLLDQLAEKDDLNSYVKKPKGKHPPKQNQSAKQKRQKPADSSDTDEATIYTIAGGYAGGGPTVRGNKDSIRKLDVNSANRGETAGTSFPEVIISEKDSGGVRRPRDDLIIIECKVANQRVGRILIDTGSSSDLISQKCLTKLKYRPESIHPVSHPLVGFGGGVVHPIGQVNLPVRLGERGEGRHMVICFLVVEELTAYNMILGRPTLNDSKAVIIPSLMLLKFEKDDKTVGSIRGDQRMLPH